MAIDFKKLAKEAAVATNKEYADRISSLTSFTSDEIQKIIKQNGIDKADFLKLIEVIKKETLSNEQKAEAVQNINKGVSTIISLASKLM